VAELLEHALGINASQVAELVSHTQRLNLTAARARQWARGRCGAACPLLPAAAQLCLSSLCAAPATAPLATFCQWQRGASKAAGLSAPHLLLCRYYSAKVGAKSLWQLQEMSHAHRRMEWELW
jgi:hypothetical protein